MKNIIRIAVVSPVRKTFVYSVPDNLVPFVKIGCRVTAPFKNQQVMGYILGNAEDDHDITLRDIIDIVDTEPLFHEELVPFFEWMADYYLSPVGKVIQAALPGGLNATPYREGRLTEKGQNALNSSIGDSEKKLLLWVLKNPGKRLPLPLQPFYALVKKGLMDITENPKSKKPVGPIKRKFVKISDGQDINPLLNGDDSQLRAKNEAQFLRAIQQSNGMFLNELSSMFSNAPYLEKKWTSAGLLESHMKEVIRDPKDRLDLHLEEPAFLYEQQKTALESISEKLKKDRFATCLLHGITGSGKTEVYCRSVKMAMEMGRQAIIMVPEIALAAYMEGTFRSRLGDKVTIFHSGLSQGERYDQWMKIVRGEVDLVIGPRSALFAPLPRLGLIIVDEEYDSSFKQDENPRYHARDAAVVRARMTNSLIILGAGTPSIQSFYNAVSDRYHLISMKNRIEERPLPEMEIVDMKEQEELGRKDSVLSPSLERAIALNLSRNEQTILFLNRRGFGRVYLCRSCGEPIKCLNCDLALTLHRDEDILVCHYCGFQIKPYESCPACKHRGMKAYGFGTERLEGDLALSFPGARIARMDRDSTRKRGQLQNILKRFADREIDILVGTQMVTKGYDFPNVTLVGVIAADLSLGFPDFRASERTFHLLSQVAGRAGRGDLKGRVIVQTFNPDHYAITTARDHDYATFYKKEIELRKALKYPPFSYLTCLRFKGNIMKDTASRSKEIGDHIRSILKGWPQRGRLIQVLGPAEAPLARLKGKYRYQVLIKSASAELLHYLLDRVEETSKRMLRNSGVTMIIDVDPYQML